MGRAQVANTRSGSTLKFGARWQASAFRFESLVLSEPPSRARGLSATLVSVVHHSVLITAVAILPILWYDAIPEQSASVRAFFVSPPDVAPPPPPPPPPPAGALQAARVAPARPAPVESAAFVAPIEIPDQVTLEEPSFDLGVEGGVAGGVEGGVPGGVLGGVVGGLPAALRRRPRSSESAERSSLRSWSTRSSPSTRARDPGTRSRNRDPRGPGRRQRSGQGYQGAARRAASRRCGHAGREAVALSAALAERRPDGVHPDRHGELQPNGGRGK